MDTVRRRRSSTKESEEEDGRVKGTYWRVGGRDEQERWQEWRLPWSWIPLLSTWTWNRKKERKTTTSCRDQRPTQATAAIHITMHGQHTLSLSHTHTYAHCSRETHTYPTLCIPLFACTRNHSHYSHKPHTLSSAQSVTEGYDTLTQPNTHNHKDHN